MSDRSKDWQTRTATQAAVRPAVPWLFFAVAFGWSWTFWIVAAISGASIHTPQGWVLLALGALGPTVAGIGCARLAEQGQGWADYRARLIELRRITPRWLLVIVLFTPGVMAIALVLDVSIHGEEALGLVAERVRPLLAPAAIVPFILGQLVMGPLLEEPGWRGYALDRLQRCWSALGASLILGSFWALWHLPLFFIPGTYHQGQGLGSPGFWLFMAGIFPVTVIMTWIFNHTQRSTLGAILFHFVTNLSYVLGNVTIGTTFYATLLSLVAAVGVQWIDRRRPSAGTP